MTIKRITPKAVFVLTLLCVAHVLASECDEVTVAGMKWSSATLMPPSDLIAVDQTPYLKRS